MSEDTLQMTLISMLKSLYPDILISLSLSGIKLNGNIEEKAKEISKMKKLGLVKGLPDLTLYLPKGQVLNLELKTTKGKQSPDQVAIEAKLKAMGHNYYLIRDSYHVFQLIAEFTNREYRLTAFTQLNSTIIARFGKEELSKLYDL